MSNTDTTILGPSLEDFKERAYQCVMDHFVAVAMKDERPPTQRAMDSVKLQEAYRHQAGIPSTLITREAALRGVPEEALVNMIVHEGQKAFDIELARVSVGLELDAASDYVDILRVLKRAGISFTIGG